MELLWAFLNTLQLISFFRYLKFYFPGFLNVFLQSLRIANFDVQIDFVENLSNSVSALFSMDRDYGQGLEGDYIYRTNDIETSNLILNSKGIILIVTYSFLSWAIFYTLKAKFITLPSLNTESSDKDPSKEETIFIEKEFDKVEEQKPKSK